MTWGPWSEDYAMGVALTKDEVISSCQYHCDSAIAGCSVVQWHQYTYITFPNISSVGQECRFWTTLLDPTQYTCDPAVLVGPTFTIVDSATYTRSPPANAMPANYTAVCTNATDILGGGDFEAIGDNGWSFFPVLSRGSVGNRAYQDANGTASWARVECHDDCVSGRAYFTVNSTYDSVANNDTRPSGRLSINGNKEFTSKTLIQGWQYRMSAYIRGQNSSSVFAHGTHLNTIGSYVNTPNWTLVEIDFMGGSNPVAYYYCNGVSPARCDVDGITVLKMC
jgi:hypothetical protein